MWCLNFNYHGLKYIRTEYVYLDKIRGHNEKEHPAQNFDYHTGVADVLSTQ